MNDQIEIGKIYRVIKDPKKEFEGGEDVEVLRITRKSIRMTSRNGLVRCGAEALVRNTTTNKLGYLFCKDLACI